MAILLDILSWIAMLAGGGFLLIGGIGLVRMPDFYSRLHAAGITDTIGAALILLGMMFQAGLTLITVKLVFVFAFLFFTSPTSSHAVANAAYTAGLEPLVVDDDEPADADKTPELEDGFGQDERQAALETEAAEIDKAASGDKEGESSKS